MTNSYTLSPKIRVIFFHGLNNNAESFAPLMNHFKGLGHETELIILPGHGPNRNEAKNFNDAQTVFEKSMETLKETPYVAVAYSYGSLFLQLWLKKHKDFRPLKQILLAPSLYIRKQFFIEKMMGLLPPFVSIKSLSPKSVQNFSSLFVWEYRILIESILYYQEAPEAFSIPTLVAIDPNDELVDAKTLKVEIERINSGQKVEIVRRKKIRNAQGFHHILFHPDYFEKKDWEEFTRKLSNFLAEN